MKKKKNSLVYNNNYFVLGNGVEISSNIPNKKYLMKKISFIGRIDIYHKGLDKLLSAINNCKENLRNSGWIICLYGSGQDKDKLWIKNYITNNKLSDIVRMGPQVGREDQKNIYMNSDIFIHTSRYEGQPQSILEALCNKVPVAVTKGTNMSNIVKKYSLGWCIENNYKGIESFINDLDKITISEIKDYSKYCRKYALKHCNWDIIAKQFLKIIQADNFISKNNYYI